MSTMHDESYVMLHHHHSNIMERVFSFLTSIQFVQESRVTAKKYVDISTEF